MKLTLEEKIQIDNEWKLEHRSQRLISKSNKLSIHIVEYMVLLVDRYGAQKLEHNYNHYSVEFKKEAIDRVLIYHESANESLLISGCLTTGHSCDG